MKIHNFFQLLHGAGRLWLFHGRQQSERDFCGNPLWLVGTGVYRFADQVAHR